MKIERVPLRFFGLSESTFHKLKIILLMVDHVG